MVSMGRRESVECFDRTRCWLPLLLKGHSPTRVAAVMMSRRAESSWGASAGVLLGGPVSAGGVKRGARRRHDEAKQAEDDAPGKPVPGGRRRGASTVVGGAGVGVGKRGSGLGRQCGEQPRDGRGRAAVRRAKGGLDDAGLGRETRPTRRDAQRRRDKVERRHGGAKAGL